eukprot:2777961-Rhodomonas_salina.1
MPHVTTPLGLPHTHTHTHTSPHLNPPSATHPQPAARDSATLQSRARGVYLCLLRCGQQLAGRAPERCYRRDYRPIPSYRYRRVTSYRYRRGSC